jgi:hypothetical protein
MENVFEQFFLLKYYGGWSLIESYNLPVMLRLWFVRRLSKQIEDENNRIQQQTSKNSRSPSKVNSIPNSSFKK